MKARTLRGWRIMSTSSIIIRAPPNTLKIWRQTSVSSFSAAVPGPRPPPYVVAGVAPRGGGARRPRLAGSRGSGLWGKNTLDYPIKILGSPWEGATFSPR